jgi:hypothetical protein
LETSQFVFYSPVLGNLNTISLNLKINSAVAYSRSSTDQIVGVRVLTLKFVGHFSEVSRTFWEEYVRPESMSVDTLGVYCKYARTHRIGLF